MKMVSAAKLKKAQDAITAMRPYAEKLTELLQNVSATLDGDAGGEFTTQREVNKVKEFERSYIDYLNNKHRDTLDALKAGKLDDNITDVLEKVAKELSARY